MEKQKTAMQIAIEELKSTMEGGSTSLLIACSAAVSILEKHKSTTERPRLEKAYETKFCPDNGLPIEWYNQTYGSDE